MVGGGHDSKGERKTEEAGGGRESTPAIVTSVVTGQEGRYDTSGPVLDEPQRFGFLRTLENLEVVQALVSLGLTPEVAEAPDDLLLAVDFEGGGRRVQRLIRRGAEEFEAGAVNGIS